MAASIATFGSIIGYSAYLYALDKLPVALVSTYTYVNPIVACVLGLGFYLAVVLVEQLVMRRHPTQDAQA